MADHEIASFDEAGEDLKTPQGADRYVAKKGVHFEQPITTDSTIDGRDVAADGALLDTALQPADVGTAAASNTGDFATAAQGVLAGSATQPGDNVSTLTNDAGYEANVALASQAEAEAGIENTKTMTALRVAQAIANAAALGIQSKYDGVTAPTTTNDDSEGYSIGSIWVVITPGSEDAYMCVDPTTNLAVWFNLTFDANDPAIAEGWRDLRAAIIGTASGPAAPTLTAFGPSANIKQMAFAVGDSVYLSMHVDHDIKAGSTCYPHVHWTTNGTNIQPVKWELRWISAAGHNQANFGSDVLISVSEAAQGTAWRHMITEDNVGFVIPEVDSLVMMELKRVTNGGTENLDTVFGLYVDIHYMADRNTTPSRLPDFYT